MANPRRRTVAAKNTPQHPTALDTRKCQVFTEGRGTMTSKLKEMIMPRITPVVPGRADVVTHTYLAYSVALANDGLNANQKEGMA